MRRREPFYRQAADWTIVVDRETRQEAAETIAAKYTEGDQSSSNTVTPR